MENKELTPKTEVAKTFHAIQTDVLQEVIDFLIKQPFESVNNILFKISKFSHPVLLNKVETELTSKTEATINEN